MIKKMLILLVSLSISGCSSPQKPTIPATIKLKVFIIIFNPIIEAEQNKRLTEVLGWNDPDSLAEVYRSDLYEVSKGFLDYQIVKRSEVDAYPIKLDGFRYDDDSFLKYWRERKGFHQPDAVDYTLYRVDWAKADSVARGAGPGR